MGRIRSDHPNAFGHVLLLAAANDAHRRTVKECLSGIRRRPRAGEPDGHPRFKIMTASSGFEALRRAAAANVAVVDLAIPKGPGLETIRQMREAHPNLAILAYATGANASDAMAAVMAGADFFHECGNESAGRLDHFVELAIDRRLLTHRIEESEAEMEAARGRLAQLAGEMVSAVPGFRALHNRQDVLPFREAARRYLLNATLLFPRDPRGLAKALGVSYFSLRRLLVRYDVAFPAARSRK
jgi:DNA-binding NarL/FixJ family response regulator